MPNKEFIESYPLYKKFQIENLPLHMGALSMVQINMVCHECSSNQTFVMTNTHYENFQHNTSTGGVAFRMVYQCSHCQSFERLFFVKIDDELNWIMKIGQFPPWDISGEPNIERMLGEYSDYYKRGLICESQGYGIGAYAYYRRIVEETIGTLLDEIPSLMSGEELAIYESALTKVKETTVARDKIELVKDLLPAILRPNNSNPLVVLHSTLSKGLHDGSEDDCLNYAQTCREILVFLVKQIATSKSASKEFSANIQKLLDKRSQVKSQ